MVTFRASTYVIIWLTIWLVMSTSSLGRKTKHRMRFRISLEDRMKVCHISMFETIRYRVVALIEKSLIVSLNFEMGIELVSFVL